MSKYPILLGVVTAAVVVASAAAAPGDLDPGFGNGGIVVTATAPGDGEDGQNGLAIQRNGRIVVGGSSDMGPAAGGHQWRVTRYKSNGDLDGSFGVGGTAITSMSGAGGLTSTSGTSRSTTTARSSPPAMQ